MPERPKAPLGESSVLKRSITLGGHKTSVTLEDAFWDELKRIAAAQGVPVGQLIAAIDSERRERQYPNLSSAIRVFVLDYYRSRMGEGGAVTGDI
jgi:predicted DNA-binding ribbon-helix-helix protein